MGKNAVQTGKCVINFEFKNDPDDTLILPMRDCNVKVENHNTDGYYAEECTCSFCEEACNPNIKIKMPGFLDGFKYQIVLIVYGSLILISFVIMFLKRKYNSNHIEQTEENESLLLS